MKHIVIGLSSVLLLLSGCNSEPKELNSQQFYDTENLSKEENIIYSGFSLDTLKISDLETSYVGQFSTSNDTLYFSDERFAYVFVLTKNGEFIAKHIGKGAGPNEVLELSGDVISKDDFISYNNKNSSISVFNKNFEKQGTHRMDWQIKRTYEEVLNKPIPEIGDSYEFDYGIPNILKKWDKDHISIAITASHPKFNGYFDSELYYNYSRILALVNIHTGKVDNLVGRRSPEYLSKENIPNFDHFNYDTYEDIDEVYINFWADTNIYLYSKKENKIIGKFGQAGRDMKTDYRLTNSYEDAEDNYKEDMELYGSYTFLKYFPDEKMVMRGYYKGEDSSSDGLQIYKDNQLIADIDVPKGLQVIGMIQNEFYATTPQDVDRDYLEVYKIKFK